ELLEVRRRRAVDRNRPKLDVETDLRKLLPDQLADRHRGRGAVHVEDRLPPAWVAARQRPRPLQASAKWLDVRVFEAGHARREVLVGRATGLRSGAGDELIAVEGEVHCLTQVRVVAKQRPR